MIHAKTVVVLLAALALVAPFSEAAPKGGVLSAVWSSCPRAGPNLNECMAKALANFIPAIIKGVPEYGIPSLDPIQLGTEDFSTNDLKMVTKNGVMSGMFTDAKIVLVEADPDKYTLRVNLKIPKIVTVGEYEMSGKLLMMPVSGEGHYTLTYTDVSLDLTSIGKAETRDGKNYMSLEDVKVVLMPSALEAKVENLFNGNKELSDNFHKFANENWKEIYGDMKEKLWANMGAFFKKSFAKLYHETPYDDIYSP